MGPYSLDLRTRIVHAYLAHQGSQADLAECFRVSERWVQNLLRRQRETGSIAPLPHGGGRERIIGADREALLLNALAETPDASLEELRDHSGGHGSRVGIPPGLGGLDSPRRKKDTLSRTKKT